jgi:GNAT superfamily N-acetyltransferase
LNEVVEVIGGADLDEVRRLFGEYASWIGVDLSFQGFTRELAELPGDYVAPDGTLLLARVGGVAAGCVAAHRWQTGVCEMKRLFVRERFRGSGLGVALAQRVITWAREARYQRVLLDTLPSMEKAYLLYVRLGFREVAPYRFNPVPGAKFLELKLE